MIYSARLLQVAQPKLLSLIKMVLAVLAQYFFHLQILQEELDSC